MRLLLLIPPIPASVDRAWFLREERHAAADDTPVPPYMGPSILGMVHHEVPKAELGVLDAMAEGLRGYEIRDRVREFGPDLIVCLPAVNHLNEPDERLCLELPYPTVAVITPVGSDPAEAIRMYGLRTPYFVHTDETEWTVTRAVQEFIETRRIEQTPGLVINAGGQIHRTRSAPISNMEHYPAPAFNLFPIKQYIELQDRVTRYTPEYHRTAILNTMKGCPFHCQFCIVGSKEAKPRVKSAVQMVSEVRELHSRYGFQRFVFLNSEIAASLKVAKEFCRLMITSEMPVRFYIKNRVELLDEELLELLKWAGCEAIAYGIETADPRLQRIIQKNIDLARARRNIALTKKSGIKVHYYMMLGLPGETRESLELNARFIAETKPDSVDWGILFPEVGSPWYETWKADRTLVESDWGTYRREDKLTFRHDIYRSIEEIQRARLWLQNRYRWSFVRDGSLPLRTRLCYFAYYLASNLNYLMWPLTHWNRLLLRVEQALALSFFHLLSRVNKGRVL